MSFIRLNIHRGILVPWAAYALIAVSLYSCTSIDQREKNSIPSQEKRWYRQALVDLGARIQMSSVTDGVAISRGIGKDVKGKAYRFNNGQWVPFLDFPYSDYPLIARSDSSNLWTVNHLTHDGAYRPVLKEFTPKAQKNIPLPAIMWDEIDYVMFKGIHRFSDGSAWMVGQQGHILYYNGTSWKEIPSPLINRDRATVYEGDLNDICMTSKQTGWAVGRNGIIIRFNAGEWKKVTSPVDQPLQKIAMLNDSTGWAVGNSGTIVHCKNYQWTKIDADVREQLLSVEVLDEHHAWIVGNNSTLLSFDGEQWKKDESITNYDDLFADISVIRDSSGTIHLWIIGNEGIYTTYQSLGVSFTDITDQAGLRRVGRLGHFFKRSDRDLPDIVVANDGGTSLLYERRDDGLYADVTGRTELLTSPKDALVMAIGDVNNDGEEDILEVVDHRNFGFYLGTAAGGFRDFTSRSALQFDEINPLFPFAAKFIDLNNDGNLDLYISNYDFPDQIFLGDGTGRLERFRDSTGITKILNHASYGALFGDFTGDGLIDIMIPYYVSSKKKFFSMYRNMGGMNFTEIDDSLYYSTSDLSPTAMGILDFNNDGFLDVYIHSQKVAPILWMNNGVGKFTDVSLQYGFNQFAGQLEPINGIVGCADVNNDGWTDIFAGSRLFLNSPNGYFTEVSERAGLQFVGTPSFSDVDNDGDQDLFIGSSRSALGKGDRAALYRNNLNNKDFIKVRVSGDVSNRSGIGIRIEIRDRNGSVQSKYVGFGGSQLTAQNLNEVHFGVRRNSVSSILVQFPSGIIQYKEGIQSGSIIDITESNVVKHAGILLSKSFFRTAGMLTPFFVIQVLIASVAVLLVFFGLGFRLNSKKIVHYRFAIPLMFIVLFSFIHLTVYESIVISTLVSVIGTSLVSMFGLITLRSIVQKREAQYIGHYKIQKLLGAGGMGTVYHAVDTSSKRIVALKVLNPELLKDPENRRRLSAEGHLLSSFDHPNIVKVFEIGESDGRGFIAMEYLNGGTLRERLEREHPLSLEEMKQYLLQICDGLAAVHAAGIIHRDLKTGNVMLAEDGTVRIMDFGLSKSPLVTTMTTLGTVLGTLGYVAPEQVTGLEVDQRTDIFSFGVLMYELLTKELPFKGENEIALIHSIFNSVPAAPSEKRPDISKEWDAIVMKCLSKDPKERYTSVNEIRIHLNTSAKNTADK